MGNNVKNKRMSARRVAMFLAALGALVMSSGIAMMVTATPANADSDPKIVVCKYVSTPGGVLQGGNNPIEPNLNSIKNAINDPDWVNDPNRTFPKYWGDAQGGGGGSVAIGYAGEGLTIADCPGEQPPPPATCPEGTDHAGEEIPEGQTAEDFCNDEVLPPAVCDEGTDHAGEVIPEGQTAEAFCNDATVIVEPPTVVSPPKKHHTKTQSTVTPTVVHAGLSGATVQDMRGEQGLALTFAGMVMLVAAGGLGLRVRGSASRI